MNKLIYPSELVSQTLTMPPSKSHSIRAILFASLAKGRSRITGLLDSPDIDAMIHACRTIGAKIMVIPNGIEVEGVAGQLKLTSQYVDAGNSGQVARFMAAIAACCDQEVTIDGDESIRHNRPMVPLLQALEQRGVMVRYCNHSGQAPFTVKGPVQPGCFSLEGQDSQPVSALLMMAPLLSGQSQIHVSNPGETPWIDLTLNWLKRMGVTINHHHYEDYRVNGSTIWPGFNYSVAKDYSALAFFAGIVAIGQVSLRFHGFDPNDVQGDKIVLTWLASMGVGVSWQKDVLLLESPRLLRGGTFDMSKSIDSIPIMAVVGCFASEPVRLMGAGIARSKECDRLAEMTSELKKMGADITEGESELLIRPSQLKGHKNLTSHRDHRVAMALTIAALRAQSESILSGCEWVRKSFPDFYDQVQLLKVKMIDVA